MASPAENSASVINQRHQAPPRSLPEGGSTASMPLVRAKPYTSRAPQGGGPAANSAARNPATQPHGEEHGGEMADRAKGDALRDSRPG